MHPPLFLSHRVKYAYTKTCTHTHKHTDIHTRAHTQITHIHACAHTLMRSLCVHVPLTATHAGCTWVWLGQVLYGNVSGFDFAFYQNSYLYHTTRDVPWTVDPASLEHMVCARATMHKGRPDASICLCLFVKLSVMSACVCMCALALFRHGSARYGPYPYISFLSVGLPISSVCVCLGLIGKEAVSSRAAMRTRSCANSWKRTCLIGTQLPLPPRIAWSTLTSSVCLVCVYSDAQRDRARGDHIHTYARVHTSAQ
jgi:hypothetical protein